jgi:hypothetical protein
MTQKEFILDLSFFSVFTPIIPVVFGTLKIRTFDLNSKVLFFYLFVAFTVEMIGIYFSLNNEYNLFIFYIFSFLEFSFFCFIFMNLLNYPKKYILFSVFTAAFGVLAIIDFYINGARKMNEISRNTECILLMFFSILYFYKLIKKPIEQSLISTFSFWFCSSVLIYFAGSFFIFLFTNYLLIRKSPETLLGIYAIHSVFNIIFNLLLAVTITRKPYVA